MTALTLAVVPQNSQSVRPDDLTGTLDIKADLPSLVHSMSPCQGITSRPAAQGWVFVGGQLMGKLPLAQSYRLTPDRYEVRLVVASADREQQGIWTGSRDVIVRRGTKTTMDTDPRQFGWHRVPGERTFWSDTECRSSGSRDGDQYYFASLKPSREYVHISPNVSGEAILRRLEADPELKWKGLVASEEWKALADAADRLRLSPPSRRRVWVELPWALGGPRELDPEQLKMLSEWFSVSAANAVDPRIRLVFFAEHSPEERERFRQRVHLLDSFAADRIQWLTGVIKDVVGRLEKAPDGRR